MGPKGHSFKNEMVQKNDATTVNKKLDVEYTKPACNLEKIAGVVNTKQDKAMGDARDRGDGTRM